MDGRRPESPAPGSRIRWARALHHHHDPDPRRRRPGHPGGRVQAL